MMGFVIINLKGDSTNVTIVLQLKQRLDECVGIHGSRTVIPPTLTRQSIRERDNPAVLYFEKNNVEVNVR